MNDIILSTQNGEPVVSSRQIAKSFGKEHKDVLRAIAGMAKKLDIFYAANKLTDEQYAELTEMLTEKTGA